MQITPRIGHYVRRRSCNFGVLKPILRSHDKQLTTSQNKQDCLINDEQINDTIGSPLQAVSLPSLKDTQITQGLQPFLPNFFLSNVRSISNKVDELGVVLQKNCIDFAGITETWLNSNIPDSSINIHDFNLIRKDRSGQRGGGVCVFVRSNIPFVLFLSYVAQITRLYGQNFDPIDCHGNFHV